MPDENGESIGDVSCAGVIVDEQRGALPARLKVFEITVFASFSWGCDVKCRPQEVAEGQYNTFGLVCGMARIGKATNEPGFHVLQGQIPQCEDNFCAKLNRGKQLRSHSANSTCLLLRWQRGDKTRDCIAVVAPALN